MSIPEDDDTNIVNELDDQLEYWSENEDVLTGDEAWVKDILFTWPRRSAQKVDIFRRTAVLVLMDVLDELGCLPYPRSEMESLLFIVDCLWPAVSPSESPHPLHGVVVKLETGPHQTDWLWDLDRAVGMGLLDLISYEKIPEKLTYDITQKGIEFVEQAEIILPELIQFRSLAETVVPLFSSHSHERQLGILENDLTYNHVNLVANALAIIDYGQWSDSNLSARKVLELGALDKGIALNSAADHYLRSLMASINNRRAASSQNKNIRRGE